MSSSLRSTTEPVGYFVMSAATAPGISDGGVSNEVMYSFTGLSGTSTEKVFTRDTALVADLSKGNVFVFEDLGVTEYSGHLADSGATLKLADLRKVVLVSSSEGATVKPDAYMNVSGARYVPLGTLKKTGPYESSEVPASVQLLGKYF